MKNISLQIFCKLLCLHITHSWFHLFLLQCFQSQHTQTGTFSLFPRWLSYHSFVATTVRFHISQLINVRFYWWTKLFIDWRTPKFSKLIYFPNWSHIQNQKYLFDILFSIHLLLVLKNDEDVALWALYCHVFLKLLTVFRSVVNCCEVLNEHYLFWFHLLKHVVLESNFLLLLFLSAVEKISRGSQSWPSIRWETESSMPSFLRGELSLLFVCCFWKSCFFSEECAL